MVASFDELNDLGLKRRSIPYKEYFGEMELSDSEKRARIEVAERLEQHFLQLFLLLDILEEEFDVDYLTETFSEKYIQAISGHVLVDLYIIDYANRIVNDIINTTIEQKEKAFTLSEDRAVFLAENESNSVMNYEQLQRAKDKGYKKKKWIAMKDRKTRHTHFLADGVIKDIDEPFEVGIYEMMTPKDDSIGAGAEEIVNCRCSLKFYK